MTEGHFHAGKAPMLDSAERVREMKPLELVRDIGKLGRGMTGIDLGCGAGVFTLFMAACVGDGGRVYAVDDSAEMLERVKAKNPPPSVRLVRADVALTGLDGQVADLCLLASVLHEAESQGALMAEAFRLLKPGGRLVVMEWKAEAGILLGPPPKLRLSRLQIEKLFAQAGFVRFEHLDWASYYYVATGCRPGPVSS